MKTVECYFKLWEMSFLAVMRLWHGKVPIEKADEYEKFLIEKAVPDYSSVDGLLKMYFLRRNEGSIAHFLLITIWDSLESIKKFAGDEPELAKYYLEDDNFLLEKEKYVAIYRVFYEK